MHGHRAFGKSRYSPVKARGLICNFPSLFRKYKNRLRVLLSKKPIRNIEQNVTVHSLRGSISAECFTVTPRTLEVEGGGGVASSLLRVSIKYCQRLNDVKTS